MPYKDLREFIAQVDDLGALRRIDGADPRFEIGAITEVAAGLPECPALLFDDIKGHARGFRVFTNSTTHAQRAALALGIDPTLKPLDALKAWMVKRHALKARDPVTVTDAAFLENALLGDDIDLEKFPAPQWHRQEAGPISAPAASSSCVIPTTAGSTPRSIACRCTGPTRSPCSSTTKAGTAPSSPRNIGIKASPARSRSLTARIRRYSSPASNICRRASRNTRSPAPSKARRSSYVPGRRAGCRCRPMPRSSWKASCCRRAPKRCRKVPSASSPAITPPTSGLAR